MMFDIPLDLVEEILFRVPATSFKRLRSTCRRWNALLKDPRFTEKHFLKAPKESMVLMLKEYRVCPISVNLNVTPPSIEFQGALGLNESHSSLEQVKITEVFHCNGLLLCTTKDNTLLVWNPCLGETKWIQLKVDCGRNGSKFSLGYIQNNESCRSYKILWSWYSYDCKSSPPQIVLGFEIYEFSSDSWRVLDDVNHDSLLNHNSIIGTGVSLKGNTYLLASDLKERSNFLLMFDFTTERLKRLCLPHFQDVGNLDLSVVREEQLSVLNWSRTTSKMEIWITKNIDTDSTLLWRLHLDTRCNWVRIFSSLLIDEEKKVVLCCNVNDDETSKNMVYIIGEDDHGYYIEIPFVQPNNIQRVLLIRNKKWYSSIFSSVPSLFQIQ